VLTVLIAALTWSTTWAADMLLRSGTDGDAAAGAAGEALAGAAVAGAAGLAEEPFDPPQAVAPAARTTQSTTERASRLEYMTIL
jgi:hypothetical protein